MRESQPVNAQALTSMDIVLIGLSMLGGVSYQRTGAVFCGVSKNALNKALHHFTKVVNIVLKPQYLHLPTINQLRRNDHHFRQKWKLPGFGYGIDGVLIPFEEKPRNLPPNRNPQSFFSRKLRYAINCMAIGGPDGLFYHLDLRSPGAFSDSSTWRASRKKLFLFLRHNLVKIV